MLSALAVALVMPPLWLVSVRLAPAFGGVLVAWAAMSLAVPVGGLLLMGVERIRPVRLRLGRIW